MNIILVIASAFCLSFGVMSYVLSVIQVRKARKIRNQADRVVEESIKLVLPTVLGRAARSPLQGMQVLGTEEFSREEFVAALNAAGLPTPGCSCEVCDQRRVDRAAKQAGE